jgi:hypothetical protein
MYLRLNVRAAMACPVCTLYLHESSKQLLYADPSSVYAAEKAHETSRSSFSLPSASLHLRPMTSRCPPLLCKRLFRTTPLTHTKLGRSITQRRATVICQIAAACVASPPQSSSRRGPGYLPSEAVYPTLTVRPRARPLVSSAPNRRAANGSRRVRRSATAWPHSSSRRRRLRLGRPSCRRHVCGRRATATAIHP